jgi:predicted phosphodiesterase
MKYDANGYAVSILGDPHLGKRFVEGVHLHRRGEREVQQWVEFDRSLNDVNGASYHIMMGDLFDAFSVDEATVLRAAEQYVSAAVRHRSTHYYILRGNHDAVRDADKKSSFDVFAALVADQGNITVVAEEARIDAKANLVFFPWHPFKSAAQIVAEFDTTVEVAFGHWDTKHFGAENPNLLPFDALKKLGVMEIYTGHEHKAFEAEVDGIKLICTGSMLPYAHGEGDMYITVALADLGDPAQYHDKCLRVLLRPGEELPEIDCLQLTAKRVQGEEIEQVVFEEFDLQTLFSAVMVEKGVEEPISTEVWGFYQGLKTSR